MAQRGRKPLYESPDALRKKVEEYFSICEKRREFPDLAGMRIHLRMSKRMMDYYTSEEHENYKEYRSIFEEAKDRRESFLVRRMTSEPKVGQGCLNALKQPDNGGYIDKVQEKDNKLEVTLKVSGLGGGSDALK